MSSRTLCASFIVTGLLAASLSLGACGGGSNSGQNAANSTPSAAGQAMNAMNGPAPIPADLKCKTQIVWVNLSSGKYHEQNDPWFGRTKHGEYMCLAEANLRGYHLAGGGNGSMGSGMSGSSRHHHQEPSASST